MPIAYSLRIFVVVDSKVASGILTLPHMGDFEQLYTSAIFLVCSNSATIMKFSEMMYHRKMSLYAKIRTIMSIF